MTDAPPTHETVLASIIASRGGRASFTPETLAIASAVAGLLVSIADGDVAGASSVAALTGMLPAKSVETAPVDPSRYSDRELAALQRLIEIGNGSRPRRERAPKSSRYWASFDLVAVLDRIEARGPNKPATEDEIVEVRTLVTAILGLVVLLGHLAAPSWAAPPDPVPEPVAPPAANVIPLRPAEPPSPFDAFAGCDLGGDMRQNPAAWFADDPSGKGRGLP
jgi:hypothetical protein